MSLYAIEFDNKHSFLKASNALLTYIEGNIGQQLSHLRLPKAGTSTNFLEIDSTSQTSLELIDPIFESSKNQQSESFAEKKRERTQPFFKLFVICNFWSTKNI